MPDTEQPSAPATSTTPGEPSSAANRLLMNRLEAVEQENRRMKRQGTILMLVTAILLGVGVALVYTAARRQTRDPHLAEGLNVHGGKVTYKAVADELGYDHTPIAELLG